VPLLPGAEIVVSHNQVDDYQTCPLKYHYVHILRIPLRQHHAVVYGSALHTAVEFYLRRRAAGNFTALEDVLRAFDDAWRNEGFLTREHEEQRKRAGVEALTRFYHEEEAAGGRPAGVEQEFGFALGATKVRGRFDRVDATPEGVVIIDYKSSDVTEQRRADQRARDSLQLRIYALAQRAMTGRILRSCSNASRVAARPGRAHGTWPRDGGRREESRMKWSDQYGRPSSP
jgi:DNA helicase-2/ATP-dependent DNA helicase PcrA